MTAKRPLPSFWPAGDGLCGNGPRRAARACTEVRARAPKARPVSRKPPPGAIPEGGSGLFQRLEAQPVRPGPFLTEALDLVGLVLVEVAGEEHPFAVVLAGQDVRGDAVEEPA